MPTPEPEGSGETLTPSLQPYSGHVRENHVCKNWRQFPPNGCLEVGKQSSVRGPAHQSCGRVAAAAWARPCCQAVVELRFWARPVTDLDGAECAGRSGAECAGRRRDGPGAMVGTALPT